MTPRGATCDANTAVEQMYAAHWRQLVRLSLLLVRDVAMAGQVVQDFFVAVHDRWSRLRDPERALAYLRQTVVNRSRSVLRHREVEPRHAPLPGVASGADDAAARSWRTRREPPANR